MVGRLSCGYMFILFNFFLLTLLLCSFYILISAPREEGGNKAFGELVKNLCITNIYLFLRILCNCP